MFEVLPSRERIDCVQTQGSDWWIPRKLFSNDVLTFRVELRFPSGVTVVSSGPWGRGSVPGQRKDRGSSPRHPRPRIFVAVGSSSTDPWNRGIEKGWEDPTTGDSLTSPLVPRDTPVTEGEVPRDGRGLRRTTRPRSRFTDCSRGRRVPDFSHERRQ